MNEELMKHLNEAVTFVKKVSPEVWNAFYKQQIIYACLELLGAIFCFATSYLLYSWIKGRNTMDDTTVVICWVLVAAGFMFFLVAMSILINPTYHAISDLAPWKK